MSTVATRSVLYCVPLHVELRNITKKRVIVWAIWAQCTNDRRSRVPTDNGTSTHARYILLDVTKWQQLTTCKTALFAFCSRRFPLYMPWLAATRYDFTKRKAMSTNTYTDISSKPRKYILPFIIYLQVYARICFSVLRYRRSHDLEYPALYVQRADSLHGFHLILFSITFTCLLRHRPGEKR